MKKSVIIFLSLFIFSFPSFADGNITTVVESKDNVTLQNGIVELTFSRSGIFDIKSIRLNNTVLSTIGSNTVPWIITYKGLQGENPELYPSYGEYKGYEIKKDEKSTSLVFTWDMKLSYVRLYPIRMTVTLPNNSELVYWDLDADLPKGWVASNFQFPRITLNKPQNGKIITSAGWGNEYDLQQQTYSANYPSWSSSMQLILMHNPQGAFYYSTEDRGASGKNFKAICSGKTVTFLSDVVTSEAWTDKNNHFQVPWQAAIGYTPEGWQAAVNKWYRPFTYTTKWGDKPLASRKIPKWLYDTDLWIRAKGVNDSIFAAVQKTIAYYGKGLGIHWYFWHQIPYDSHYPDYFPAKAPFAGMINKVQKEKCHVIPYINGRLWDPAADSYVPMQGAKASCRKADGTLYTEIYPTSNVLNTVTCPTSPIWQNILINLVDKIQDELKTNGVYIDQIGAAAPQPCWADNHGHPKGGGEFWYDAYRNLITTMYSSHLRDNNILITEENSECYADLFDILLTVNTPHSPDCRIVPLYPMVYSDRVLTCAFTYTPKDDLTKGNFRYENMMCFLFGSQLGWVEPTLLMKKESAKETAFLKDLALLRSKQHDVFYGGRFINEIIPTGDNPIRSIPDFGDAHVVCASEWLSTKGEKVVYVVNMDDVAHNVVLPNNRPLTIGALKAVRINL